MNATERMPTAPGLPAQIGPYRIERELGRGAMGVVYLGVHHALGARHAVKLMLIDPNDDPELAQRFELEAAALGRADHPGIVKVHGYGMHGPNPYYAMDLVSGCTLREPMQRGACEAVLDHLESVALALGHVHAQGMVHRDVKPENVMVTEGEVRLVDFGLAKVVRGKAEQLTRSGEVLGTPNYMAPEQIRSELEVGPHTDVFALGAILYELYAGQPPFTESSTILIVERLLSNRPPTRPEHTDFSDELWDLCRRCLLSDLRARPPDGRAFYRELVAARLAKRAPKALPAWLAPLGLLLAGALVGGLFTLAASGIRSPRPTASSSPAEAARVSQLSRLSPAPSLRPPPAPSGSPAPTPRHTRREWLVALSAGDSVLVANAKHSVLATVIQVESRERVSVLFASGEVRTVAIDSVTRDLLVPGARVFHPRHGAGTLLRRRGSGTALVDYEVERVWTTLSQNAYVGEGPAPKADPALAARDRAARPVLALWETSHYVADVLGQAGGGLEVFYLEDESRGTRSIEQVERDWIREGRLVLVRPAEGGARVRGRLTGRRLGPWAVEVAHRNPDRKAWANVIQLTSKPE